MREDWGVVFWWCFGGVLVVFWWCFGGFLVVFCAFWWFVVLFGGFLGEVFRIYFPLDASLQLS